MEPEFPESKIEQMFCCVGGDSLAPGFWLNQVPDLAFFGASQDDHAAKPNHITWRAIRNCSDDGCPGIRRGFNKRFAPGKLVAISSAPGEQKKEDNGATRPQ